MGTAAVGHLDWVQWVTVMLAIVCIAGLFKTEEALFWQSLVFILVLFIPFLRVLGVL